MERGDGGDTGLGSEWHTGAMARGLFLARFVWKSGFPSPPSRIFTWGGRGRGGRAGSGWGRGGPSPPPLAGLSPIPAPRSWGGGAPPPRAVPHVPPQCQVIDQFGGEVRGGTCSAPRCQGAGPVRGIKISFYFPISQRLSFPGLIPVRNPGVNCVLHQLEGLARLMRCVLFSWWRI